MMRPMKKHDVDAGVAYILVFFVLLMLILIFIYSTAPP